MPVYNFERAKGNDCSDSSGESPQQHNSLIELSANFDPNKPTNRNQYVLSSKIQQDESVSNSSTISSTTSEKSHCVELYKPIYVALYSKTLSYDEGDEFELINKIDDEFFHLTHLRTNTEFTIHRTHLRLDCETPLRLGSDDRGVVQRCLFQYNVPGAYLIRRSKNESNAFVLSISQIFNQRNAEDWHYLIRIHSKTRRFYFAQETRLKHLSFTSFHKLIRDETVLKSIPLSKIIPFRIEFEEDLWHIPQRHLTFERRIGKGEFGEVWRAIWKNGDRSISVAVKKLRPLRQNKSSINNFIREIEAMKELRNNYIVSLYGVAQDRQVNETLLVTELMESGDLKNWLKSCSDVPDETKIISFAFDICRGMAFLEQKSRVHRDLACRNLLLSADGKTVKIADFGLSILVNKDDFAQRKTKYLEKLPIRWTAPEVLSDRMDYSIKSDVWSFGIVLIEILLKGADPYPEEKEFSAIRTLVQSGYVHKKPDKCSNHLYNRLILPCLCFKPDERPYFKTLVELLRQWNKEKPEYDLTNQFSG